MGTVEVVGGTRGMVGVGAVVGGGRWWCSYSNFLRYLVFDLLIPFLPSLRGFNQWQPGKVELRLPEAQTLIEVCQYSVVLL